MKIIYLVFLYSFLMFGQSSNSLLLFGDDFNIAKDIPNVQLWLKAGDATTATWVDKSGNNRNLTTNGSPATGILDGKPTLIFNGVELNHQYGKTPAFVQAIPFTIYIVVKQISWTNNDYVFDGNTATKALTYQTGTTPQIGMYNSGSTVKIYVDLILGTWYVLKLYYNGASSYLSVNNEANVTGSVGTNATDGFTLGAKGDNTFCANIEVGEVIIISGTVSDANNTKIMADLHKRMPSLP